MTSSNDIDKPLTKEEVWEALKADHSLKKIKVDWTEYTHEIVQDIQWDMDPEIEEELWEMMKDYFDETNN